MLSMQDDDLTHGDAFHIRRHSETRSGLTVPEYLRRIVAYTQMDFQFTFSQMVELCRSPSSV